MKNLLIGIGLCLLAFLSGTSNTFGQNCCNLITVTHVPDPDVECSGYFDVLVPNIPSCNLGNVVVDQPTQPIPGGLRVYYCLEAGETFNLGITNYDAQGNLLCSRTETASCSESTCCDAIEVELVDTDPYVPTYLYEYHLNIDIDPSSCVDCPDIYTISDDDYCLYPTFQPLSQGCSSNGTPANIPSTGSSPLVLGSTSIGGGIPCNVNGYRDLNFYDINGALICTKRVDYSGDCWPFTRKK